MIASFTGAQSTGKTTLLNKCKDGLLHSGPWEYVPEVTRLVKRNYNVNINETGNDDTQLLIMNQHLVNVIQHRESNAILDRCIIDCVVYTRYLVEQGQVSPWVLDMCWSMFYHLIPQLDVIFYTCPKGVLLDDDGERSVNISFRDRIIELFDDTLSTLEIGEISDVNVVILTGSVEERFQCIKDNLEFKYEDTRQ